jgi:hypothetical protein
MPLGRSAIFLSRDSLFFLILSSSCTPAIANADYFINNREKFHLDCTGKESDLICKTKNNNLSKLYIAQDHIFDIHIALEL